MAHKQVGRQRALQPSLRASARLRGAVTNTKFAASRTARAQQHVHTERVRHKGQAGTEEIAPKGAKVR